MHGRSFISQTSHALSSRCFETCEKAESQTCFGAPNLNDEKIEVSHFANKKLPDITSNPSLHWEFTECGLENDGGYFTQNEEFLSILLFGW